MKKIIIKILILSYFKGLRRQEINFAPDETNLLGANETGKTTMFDAFCFLLFGKDSSDKTQFGIKTLLDGQPIEKVDHEVTGVIEVDGKEITLKRTFREKWVKERGHREPVMKRHETLFEWNNVPMTETQYNAEVAAILNEGIFKLVTNPLYFNSLKWEKRRQILVGMSPEITYSEVAMGDTEFEDLLVKLNGKTVDQYKAQISATKRKLKEELDAIPTRIDELQRSIDQEPDYAQIQANIDSETKYLESINAKLMDSSKATKAIAEKNTEAQNKIYEQRRKIDSIRHELRAKLESEDRDAMGGLDILRSENGTILRQIDEKNRELAGLTDPMSMTSIPYLTKKRESLILDWQRIDQRALVFDEHEFNCPTCKRALDPSDIDAKKQELTSSFNKTKSEQLADIEAKGQSVRQTLEKSIKIAETLAAEIESLETKSAELIAKMDAFKDLKPRPIEERLTALISNNPDIRALEALITSLEGDIKEVVAPDTTDLQTEAKSIRTKLDEYNRELATKEINDRTRKRLSDLERDEKTKAQELADLEGIEFTIDRFIKAMMDRVEENINIRFKYVRFRLFDRLVKGEEVPACITTYKGVPWDDLNTAGRIWAGIDIINSLCEFYEVSAPIFIDCRESVTVIPETESQIINLIVSPRDKKIRVQYKEQLQTV